MSHADINPKTEEKSVSSYKKSLQSFCQMCCRFFDFSIGKDKRVCCKDGKTRMSSCFVSCEKLYTKPGLEVDYNGPCKEEKEIGESMEPVETVEPSK